MSKLEEQLRLADEYGFVEITIPVDEAREALKAYKGTKLPSEDLNAPAAICRSLEGILQERDHG
jgi:hypothetical protein